MNWVFLEKNVSPVREMITSWKFQMALHSTKLSRVEIMFFRRDDIVFIRGRFLVELGKGVFVRN
jgi:hypothetical protein